MKIFLAMLLLISIIGCGKKRTVTLNDYGSQVKSNTTRIEALEARLDKVEDDVLNLRSEVDILNLFDFGGDEEFNVNNFVNLIKTTISSSVEITNLQQTDLEFDNRLIVVEGDIVDIEGDILNIINNLPAGPTGAQGDISTDLAGCVIELRDTNNNNTKAYLVCGNEEALIGPVK